jgi:hypothetical protein
MKTYGGVEMWFHIFSALVLDGEVSGQLQTLFNTKASHCLNYLDFSVPLYICVNFLNAMDHPDT